MLLDADGVIQLTPPVFRERLLALVPADSGEAFLSDVFAAEHAPLRGQGDFRVALAEVLKHWQVDVPVDEVLSIWCEIEPIANLDSLLADLRSTGAQLCLATNQQAYRARVMHEQLRYAERFEQCFYSFELGACKPDTDYFHGVLERLDTPAANVVFVDDHPPNAAAAQSVGMHALHFDARLTARPAEALRTHLEALLR